MTNIQSYQQRIYEHYLGKTIDPDHFIASTNFNQSERQFEYWWSNFLPNDKSQPILDLGCGWGGFLNFLKSKGYVNLFGIDSSPQQVEIAHKLDLTNVEVGDLFSALEQKENYYACISAFNVLEHLNKEEVLPFCEKALQSLLPGGCLLLEIPNGNSIFGSRTRYWDFTHELSFTPTSIYQIFEVIGFNKIMIKERSPVVHGIKSQIRFWLWQAIRLGLSFYLLIEQGSSGYKIFTQDMHVIGIK